MRFPFRGATGERSFALSLWNIGETLAICVPTVADAALGRLERGACDLRLESWSARVLENANVRLTVRGREHLSGDRTYILMSNHQSLYDVPTLFCVFGHRMRMIMKKELARVPVFGDACRLAGFIEIDRKDRQQAIQSLERAKAELRAGTHVWIAPEGTRSKTGELLPFKKGGFHLALETGWPILPVTLRGTGKILRAKGVRSFFGQEVEAILHPPVSPPPVESRDSAVPSAETKRAREELMDKVRAAITSGF
jgi:1-acyl-sn-glycerol-3-phosphate acyltransferase